MDLLHQLYIEYLVWMIAEVEGSPFWASTDLLRLLSNKSNIHRETYANKSMVHRGRAITGEIAWVARKS